MRYQELIERLFAMKRFNRGKQGLQGLRAACATMGLHPERLPALHVTGTNGKGSVCWKLYRALQGGGYRAGLFSSPHINSFRERIQINGECIEVSEVEEGLNYIFDHLESSELCFFEITTLLAYRYFASRGVDVAVFEVGMGGRLDATNLVEPFCSVITSLGLDHMDILGPTLADIAREKAGIIKEDCPVFLGLTADHPVVLQAAAERHSEVTRSLRQSDEENTEESNSRLSRHVLDFLRQSSFPRLDAAIIEAAVRSRPICRFEEVPLGGMRFLLDCAHNEPAFRALFSRYQPRGPKDYVILCFSEDKDIARCLEVVASHYSKRQVLLFSPVSVRSIPVERLTALVQRFFPDYLPPLPPAPPQEFIPLLLRTFEPGSTFLICGSMYILGPCRLALGLPVVSP